MRPRGVVVVEPDKPLAKGLLAEEAKQLLKAKYSLVMRSMLWVQELTFQIFHFLVFKQQQV